MIDVAQAADWVMTGPVRPCSIDSWQAAIDADNAGKANGLTEFGPLMRKTSDPIVTCSIPPPPVLTATATRSRRSGDHSLKSSPASATASLPAAIAK